MKAEIISIGSELTTGRNLDTNCQWLSLRLSEIGVPVAFHTTVADDFADNLAVFETAARRCDLVIATGGLGPTQDDLTREVLARAAGVDLRFDPDSLATIQAMFASRNREMPERNRVQAMFPAGSTILPNDRGTAPGIWMRLHNAHVAALPGVPSEMRAMYELQVRPRVLGLGGIAGGVFVQRKINTFGAGESAIEEKLFDITRRGHVPEVGITASDAVISLRIFAQAATLLDAENLIAPIETTIRERLGTFVFGVEHAELQDAVAELLASQGQTLATVEAVTGGQVGSRLASVPGAEAWYRGSLVVYQEALQRELLGAEASLLDQFPAVSPEVAVALAEAGRRRLGSDLAVSTVGIPGPEGGSETTPVGLVHVGVAWAGGTCHRSFNWSGSRSDVMSRAAKLALNAVRLQLIQAG